MARTAIAWTDFTVNFWTGCIKWSAGCKFCYMYRDKERYGQDPTTVMQVAEKTIYKILAQAEAERIWRLRNGDNTPVKIFTCSWSDFFIKEADEWRVWAWDIINKHPQFVWQILTKRTDRFLYPLELIKCFPYHSSNLKENIWIGTSIENEQVKAKRLLDFHMLKNSFFNRKFKMFLSCEPLLSTLNFLETNVSSEIFKKEIDWVIIGGESGNDTGKYLYRSCELNWFTDIIEQCDEVNIPVFVKQTGTFIAKKNGYKNRHGADINELPRWLQIQEFPNY